MNRTDSLRIKSCRRFKRCVPTHPTRSNLRLCHLDRRAVEQPDVERSGCERKASLIRIQISLRGSALRSVSLLRFAEPVLSEVEGLEMTRTSALIMHN